MSVGTAFGNRSRDAGSLSLSGSLGFSQGVVELGIGHPALRRVFERTGGSCSFIVSLDDDRIAALEVEVGYGHRGFEKEVESRGWSEALPYVGRLGTGGGLAHAIGYCLAVEELSGIEVPDRAIWLRTLGCELARLFDHFLRLSTVAASASLPSAEAVADRGVEQVAVLMTNAFGAGELGSWIRFGGVSAPLCPEFAALWADARSELLGCLVAYERVGLANPSLSRRLRGVGRLSAASGHAWGVTGPALRAAGAPVDVRIDAPYLAYGSIDFEVPIAEEGDAFDRLLVVSAEIRQSLSIIDQCEGWLSELGPGAVSSRGVDDGFQVREGRLFRSTESSTGELGFGIVSDGGGLPRRIRCRAPSFFHSQALIEMLEGASLDDLLPTVASMHLVAAECDR